MSPTLFPQYQPTEPLAYDARVNIFTGTLFPELLDGPAVDVDQVAEYHRVHRAVLVELLEDFETPAAAHLALFERLFTQEVNDFGKTFAKNRRGEGFQLWTSVWGYCTHLRHERQEDLTWAPVWSPSKHKTFVGRAERAHPVLRLITAVVQANHIPAGKKRAAATKEYVRELLRRAGHHLYASNGGKSATRARLCSTWKQW